MSHEIADAEEAHFRKEASGGSSLFAEIAKAVIANGYVRM
jgi:hypothetical protein